MGPRKRTNINGKYAQVSPRMLASPGRLILILIVIFNSQFHSGKMSFLRDLPVDIIQQNFGHRDLCPGVDSLIDLSNGTAKPFLNWRHSTTKAET